MNAFDVKFGFVFHLLGLLGETPQKIVAILVSVSFQLSAIFITSLNEAEMKSLCFTSEHPKKTFLLKETNHQVPSACVVKFNEILKLLAKLNVICSKQTSRILNFLREPRTFVEPN